MQLVFKVAGGEDWVQLEGSDVTVGRGRGNTVTLLGVGLAANHCVFRTESDCVYLHDLSSGEPTEHNGQVLSPGARVAVVTGDRILLGTLRVEVHGDEPEDEAPAPPLGEHFDRESVLLLLETIGDLHRKEDPVALLPIIVDRVIALSGADRGLLLVRGADGLESTVARTAEGADLPVVDGTSKSLPQRVLQTGEPVCVTYEETTEARPDSMVEHGLRSVICLPIRHGGSVVGVVYVDSQAERREPAEQPRQLLEAFAAQCGIALERARSRQLDLEQRRLLESENQTLRDERGLAPLAVSAAMQATLRQAERVADAEATILITGETGVGKEVVARYVHGCSGRRHGPVVVADCGAIPGPLLESILFGHAKGAFTGAVGVSEGLLGRASGGTLLLDEVGELPLELQPKLLRVLEDRSYTPVGAEESRVADVRFIACTHRDLRAMVRDGSFREDLYFRLSTFPLVVPPLRERLDDVEPLALRFLTRARADVGKPHLTGFTFEALSALRGHAWPGNVRELAHRVQRGAVLGDPPFLTVVDLDLAAKEGERAGIPPLKEARKLASDRFEVEYLSEMLRRHKGVISRAAEEAGVSRQLFQRLMRRHGLARETFRKPS